MQYQDFVHKRLC